MPRCDSSRLLSQPSNAALAGCQAARDAGQALHRGEMQLQRQNAALYLCYLALHTCLRLKKYVWITSVCFYFYKETSKDTLLLLFLVGVKSPIQLLSFVPKVIIHHQVMQSGMWTVGALSFCLLWFWFCFCGFWSPKAQWMIQSLLWQHSFKLGRFHPWKWQHILFFYFVPTHMARLCEPTKLPKHRFNPSTAWSPSQGPVWVIAFCLKSTSQFCCHWTLPPSLHHLHSFRQELQFISQVLCSSCGAGAGWGMARLYQGHGQLKWLPACPSSSCSSSSARDVTSACARWPELCQFHPGKWMRFIYFCSWHQTPWKTQPGRNLVHWAKLGPLPPWQAQLRKCCCPIPGWIDPSSARKTCSQPWRAELLITSLAAGLSPPLQFNILREFASQECELCCRAERSQPALRKGPWMRLGRGQEQINSSLSSWTFHKVLKPKLSTSSR